MDDWGAVLRLTYVVYSSRSARGKFLSRSERSTLALCGVSFRHCGSFAEALIKKFRRSFASPGLSDPIQHFLQLSASFGRFGRIIEPG